MSTKYTPDSRGTREFMNSKDISDSMRGVAAQMAAQANQQGRGSYEARARTVQGGWSATNRAGAEVVETQRDYRDVRRRVLVDISNQFRMRGGG